MPPPVVELLFAEEIDQMGQNIGRPRQRSAARIQVVVKEFGAGAGPLRCTITIAQANRAGPSSFSAVEIDRKARSERYSR